MKPSDYYLITSQYAAHVERSGAVFRRGGRRDAVASAPTAHPRVMQRGVPSLPTMPWQGDER